MRKSEPFFGFLWVYFTLAVIGAVLINLLITEQFDPLFSITASTALTSLTHLSGNIPIDVPATYTYLSLLITQLSGLALLSVLLWYYWQLFGNEEERSFGIFRAFKLTFVICFIAEGILLLFFLYGVSAVPSENTFLSAFSLAVNSFMNAGIPVQISQSHPDIVNQNFILQIGIIVGSGLGSLGIFVLYELLSPKKLRERLADISIDWSFITKVSVFGTVLILATASAIFYLTEMHHVLMDKKIVDGLIASLYEISASRGFGSFLFGSETHPTASFLKLIVSLFGSAPFSTGGGFTLLGFIWFISLFGKEKDKGSATYTSFLISKNLFLYTTIAFITTFSVRIALNTDMSINHILSDHWQLYSTREYSFASITNPFEKFVALLTVISGRLSFITACFLTLKQINNKS